MFNEPQRWKEPSLIFVNSMSDLFFEAVDKELCFKIFDKMREAPWHKYLVLTKRAGRMKEMVDAYCEYAGLDSLPDFIWLGVSVEDERRAALRLSLLDETRAKVKFVSCEPLLESVDFSKYPVMDWYIVGGESVELGRERGEARPFDIRWAYEIKAFCEANSTAFHMKQVGSNPVGVETEAFKGDSFEELPSDLQVREYPSTE